MIIEEEDFRLTSVNEFSPHFDLELQYVIRPRGKEPRLEFKNVAYGITLESALRKIAQFRINNAHPEAITLKTYLEEFKKEVKSLKELCGN